MPHLIDVVGVVVHRRPCRNRRAPGTGANGRAGGVARPAERGVGVHAEAPLPELRLQRIAVVQVVKRRGRPEREMRRARATRLGGDELHPGRRARAVDRARRRALEDLDIESVEILKGPAASAIYGSRAAAGVVLITTKSGRSGPTHFTFRSSTSFDDLNHSYPLQPQ